MAVGDYRDEPNDYCATDIGQVPATAGLSVPGLKIALRRPVANSAPYVIEAKRVGQEPPGWLPGECAKAGHDWAKARLAEGYGQSWPVLGVKRYSSDRDIGLT
jgi:hypothetical protein